MARSGANAYTSDSGIWKKDSVKDAAESVGIANLPDDVAAALAGDVEYRLWEIIEESLKFMRHSRRTRLKVEDVNNALKVRNLEPLWGFGSTSHMPFKKTVTPTGTVYHVEDEEIDLSKIIKNELPPIPRDISFTAHWLAIEGVQPLIKENPSPAELARLSFSRQADTRSSASTAAGAVVSGASALAPTGSGIPGSAGGPNATLTSLVKHVLSRELQLYFTRLTEALEAGSTSGQITNASGGATAGIVPQSEMKEAALGSVRSDPGLHQLVPYLIAWAGEQIANHLDDLPTLERALDLFHAMLENPTLYIEPYLHQLTPPVLTCLLTSSLPAPRPGTYPIPLTIRTSAASLLHLLLARHSQAYPSLKPRVVKTLLRGLAGVDRGLGGRWGAARGLSGIVSASALEEQEENELVKTREGSIKIKLKQGDSKVKLPEGKKSTSSDLGVKNSTGGGNRAVREWIGGGLKTLGELIEGEEETEEGERDEVVREVVTVLKASLLTSPSLKDLNGDHEDEHDDDEDDGDAVNGEDDDEDEDEENNEKDGRQRRRRRPSLEKVQDRYGRLFGEAIYNRWSAGGKEIWQNIGNPSPSSSSSSTSRPSKVDKNKNVTPTTSGPTSTNVKASETQSTPDVDGTEGDEQQRQEQDRPQETATTVRKSGRRRQSMVGGTAGSPMKE